MNQRPSHHLIHRDGGVAMAEAGVVLLDGPDVVAIAMTPEAATATARSLLAAAAKVQKQTDNPVKRA